MASLAEEKKELRISMRKVLRELPDEVRAAHDKLVQQYVIQAEWYKSAKRVGAYFGSSVLREVATADIITEILKDHPERSLYVPLLIDGGSSMRLLRITSLDDGMAANSMAILEPTPKDAHGNKREDAMDIHAPLDLLLVPGLAFDTTGGRMGKGSGVYDAYIFSYIKHCLRNSWKPPVIVALAYSVQVLKDKTVPMDENDVPVDALVTDEGILLMPGGALLPQP
eukprot:TRINITY_DN526_c0_g1_i2.p1 TRINITY_DN526_c0_g1~~TRINITY_DN526_c0_g1_i2.p1  ORF type:complete len:225 (-),score=51.91 TRINITY_DN526_c0_g1_i2:167-841(-)